MDGIDLEALRAAIRQDRYVITTHVKQRMVLRRVTDEEMKQVVTTGDLIEEYPDATPFVKSLLMAEVGGEPLYVACAFDGRYRHCPLVRPKGPGKIRGPGKGSRNYGYAQH